MRIKSFEIATSADIERVAGQARASSSLPDEVRESVRAIIDDVRGGGDAALAELTERFDGARIDPGDLEVAPSEFEKAWEALGAETRSALEKAEARIARFAREGLAADVELEVGAGLKLSQLQRPLETAGIYVPGGRYPYPSTVLMAGVPAREAGVERVIFCIPPDADGGVPDATLAAVNLVGGCRAFRVGGAQAVAAMALGTETVPRCNIIAGPGNVFVTAAKRMLSSLVAIDLEAGPSEIAVYVDGSVDLGLPASDVLAQIEHDPLATAVMVSVSGELLEAASGVIMGLSDAGGGEKDGTVSLVLCADDGLAVDFLERLAPEHLELMVEDAEKLIGRIRSAGCVFVGPYSAVALGDYIAGPSHVLPTGGSAAMRSGLSGQSFRRTMNVIRYTRDGFALDAPEARLLADLEGLRRHALSLDIRMRD